MPARYVRTDLQVFSNLCRSHNLVRSLKRSVWYFHFSMIDYDLEGQIRRQPACPLLSEFMSGIFLTHVDRLCWFGICLALSWVSMLDRLTRFLC